MRTRRATCACIRSAKDALGFGTCGAVLIFYYDLGVTGRYFDGEYFPAVIIGRNLSFCHDYSFQLHRVDRRQRQMCIRDSSQRALVWLSKAGITNSYNHHAAEDALRSAAYTYVVAALSSLATLIYYIMIYMGRRD